MKNFAKGAKEKMTRGPRKTDTEKEYEQARRRLEIEKRAH